MILCSDLRKLHKRSKNIVLNCLGKFYRRYRRDVTQGCSSPYSTHVSHFCWHEQRKKKVSRSFCIIARTLFLSPTMLRRLKNSDSMREAISDELNASHCWRLDPYIRLNPRDKVRALRISTSQINQPVSSTLRKRPPFILVNCQ